MNDKEFVYSLHAGARDERRANHEFYEFWLPVEQIESEKNEEKQWQNRAYPFLIRINGHQLSL